jgi:hypothetical protein
MVVALSLSRTIELATRKRAARRHKSAFSLVSCGYKGQQSPDPAFDRLLPLTLGSVCFLAATSLSEGKEAHMGRLTLPRVFLVALITALAVLAPSALGAKPVAQFHDHFTESFSDEICGIPVDVDLVVTDNFFLYADESSKDTSSVRATFTNPENGKSVVVSNAGQISGPPPIVDEEAGTITFLTSFKGLPEKIQTASGPVLLRDAGIITFADTFDLETGEFISSEVIVNKGPHPEADSDFTLFCEVISEALT